MTKKKINKKEHSSLEELYCGVVLEDINSKLDLVLEAHQGLDRKIDKNHEKFQDFHKETNYKFEITLGELRIIRNELKEKVGLDEFILLENRVLVLEKSRK